MKLKPVILFFLLAALLDACTLQAAPQKFDPQVEHILSELDKTAATFQSFQADIKNTKFTKVVDDTTVETGKIWFRHDRRGNKIKIEFEKPSRREILIADGVVTIHYPKIKKTDEYPLGSDSFQNQAELGLLAGVGSSGETLRKTYLIKYLGEEKVTGKKTVKLVLTPRNPKTKTIFSTQEVWIDSERWLPVRQKLVEPAGDSLTIDFDHVEKNKKISDKTFKIRK